MEIEKKTEMVRGYHWYYRRAFWVWMAMVAIILTTVPLVVARMISYLGAVIVTLVIMVIWTKKNFRQVGTIEVPSQAVLTRFARAVDAVPSGLYFVLRPIEGIKEFPLGQYVFHYRISQGLYSRAKAELSSQPLEVEAAVYLRFPRVDKEYSFSMSLDKARESLKKKKEPGRILGRKGIAWGRVWGGELLKEHTYYRLPVRDLTKPEAIDTMGKFLEGGVIGGIRHIMSIKTSTECKEKKPEIEDEIKDYLLSEEGNPFFELGIPKECVTIELTKVKLPEETEKAYIAPEVARKTAEAAKSKGKGEADALREKAKGEAAAIKKKMKVLIDQGAEETVAGIIAAGGIEGKGMTIEQYRDLMIANSLAGGGFAIYPRPKRFRKRKPIKKEKPEKGKPIQKKKGP